MCGHDILFWLVIGESEYDHFYRIALTLAYTPIITTGQLYHEQQQNSTMVAGRNGFAVIHDAVISRVQIANLLVDRISGQILVFLPTFGRLSYK